MAASSTMSGLDNSWITIAADLGLGNQSSLTQTNATNGKQS